MQMTNHKQKEIKYPKYNHNILQKENIIILVGAPMNVKILTALSKVGQKEYGKP